MSTDGRHPQIAGATLRVKPENLNINNKPAPTRHLTNKPLS